MSDTLDELLAAQQPVRELVAGWATRNELDLDHYRRVHDEATVAAHRHYCATVGAYRTLAEELGMLDCADAAEIRAELASTDDLFKSYDEAWLDAGNWPAMTDWLRGICSDPLRVDLTGVSTIEQWCAACERAGVRLWFSSGTTGHLSFVPRDRLAATTLERKVGAGLAAMFGTLEAAARYDAVLLTFQGGNQGLAIAADRMATITRTQTFLYDFPITPDGIRAAAKGGPAAREFLDRTVGDLPARYDRVIDSMRASAEGTHPVIVLGAPFQVADICRRLVERDDRIGLADGSLLFVSGGWKSFEGEKIARDGLVELVTDRLGVPASRYHESYGMTECSTVVPMCAEQRFHIPPTLWPMVVDDALQPMEGLGRGRYAFADPDATSFPGLFITGDEVELTLDPCGCGRPGFSIVGEIRRAPGREVKGCGGVMAAVRG